MARKSNKTSHVLHLLAGEEPVGETAEEAAKEPAEEKEEPAQQPKAAAEQEPEPETPNISIVSAGSSEGDPLADLIREQLEEDFPEEILHTPPASGGEPEPAPPEANIPAPAQDSAPQEPEANIPPAQDSVPREPEPEADSGSAPAASPAEDGSLKEPNKAKDSGSAHYSFINVMEYVIRDVVLDHMKKFDMCTCERCRVDTMALALTNCPAKYIVVDGQTVSPLLNYYSNKFIGAVTVELTKACTIIKENPRH